MKKIVAPLIRINAKNKIISSGNGSLPKSLEGTLYVREWYLWAAVLKCGAARAGRHNQRPKAQG